MIRTRSSAVFACAAKACAPPPVGKGGSLGTGSAAAKAAAKEKVRATIKGSGLGAFLAGESRRIKESDPALAKVIGSYINQGYFVMNRLLRDPKGRIDPVMLGQAGARDRAELQRMVKTMRGGFDNPPRLKASATLFRGINTWVNLKVGSTISDKGFVSTSLSEDAAKAVSGGDNKSWTLFRITAGKGTAYLPGKVDEEELILAPRSRFRVLGKSQVMDGEVTKYIYDLELL